ncbi:PKD domain-containing protein [Candidatus Woesebacteria bacterium]|nr:MAG: PKD domain-containing protein [Candidatus Woesebacteria bacterium]
MFYKNAILLAVTALTLTALPMSTVFATNTQVPSFPSCPIGNTGDWVHSDHGFHHIPGQEATIEGSDDVYQLENSNFIQCLCAIDDSKSTQTIWWNITNSDLSDQEIQNYLSDGWYLENGGSWNLIQGNTYLAKNSSRLCAEPTPTITPVPTITLTPTPGKELARCTGIEANPREGTAALYVKFAGAGIDYQGQIKEYHWDFGDNSNNQPERINTKNPEAIHIYNNKGTYKAKLQVMDSRGVWHGGNSECELEVVVKEEPTPQVAGAATELPSTGFSAPNVIVAGLGLTALGAIIKRRFKLI